MLRRYNIFVLSFILISIFLWPIVGYAGNIQVDKSALKERQPEVLGDNQIYVSKSNINNGIVRLTFSKFDVSQSVAIKFDSPVQEGSVKTVIIKVHSTEPSTISGDIKFEPFNGLLMKPENLIISNESGLIINNCTLDVPNVTLTTSKLVYGDKGQFKRFQLESDKDIKIKKLFTKGNLTLLYNDEKTDKISVEGKTTIVGQKGNYDQNVSRIVEEVD